MGYRELPEEKWRKWYGITAENQPDVAIIWGIFSSIMEEGFWTVPEFLLAQFGKKADSIEKIRLPHTFIIRRKKLNIAEQMPLEGIRLNQD